MAKKRIVCVVILALVVVGSLSGWYWYRFHFVGVPAKVRHDLQRPMVWLAGNGQQGFADGAGTSAKFFKPIRLAPFGADSVLVADIYNHAIRIVSKDGRVSTLAGAPQLKGYLDGPASKARFNSPHGVAVRADGVIAIAEAENCTIRLLTPRASAFSENPDDYQVTTLAGTVAESGFRDGAADSARFNAPHAVAWGPTGDLYVADIGNARVRRIHDGQVSTVAGTADQGAEDGGPKSGTLKYPMDIFWDTDGSLLILDAGSHRIRRWTKEEGLTTPWANQSFAMPHGITVSKDGTIIVAEMYAHRVVRSEKGSVYDVVCGTGTKGTAAQALSKPADVLVHADTLWIADLGNHRIMIVPWPK